MMIYIFSTHEVLSKYYTYVASKLLTNSKLFCFLLLLIGQKPLVAIRTYVWKKQILPVARQNIPPRLIFII
jgi:hypothetical protein